MREGPWALYVAIHSNSSAAATWTNMPAAETLLFGSSRHIMMVDISGFTQVRLKVNKQATAATTGAKLILRYSPTFSTTVSSYVDIGITEVSVAIDTTNSFLDSGWIDLNPDVFVDDDVYIAIIGSGGNGTLDPQFGLIGIGLH